MYVMGSRPGYSYLKVHTGESLPLLRCKVQMYCTGVHRSIPLACDESMGVKMHFKGVFP